MNVTLEVRRYRVFGPTPVLERVRKELQLSAWRWKAAFDCVPNLDAGETTSNFITIGGRYRNNVWSRRFCGTSKHSTKSIYIEILQLFSANSLIVDLSDLVFDFKSAIATHEFQRG